MKIIIKIVILCFVIFPFIDFTAAQYNQKKPVIIKGNNVKSRLVGEKNGEKIYLTELTGEPLIKYDNSVLKADKILIRGKNGEIAEAVGNVVLIDRKNKSRMKSQKAVFYKETNIVEFSGKPNAIIKREDDNSTVNIRAEIMKYNIDDKIAEALVNVKVRNNDLHISAQKALFDRKDKTVIFSQNPEITRGEDFYKAENVYYHTDRKLIVLENNANIKTFSEEKDEKTGKMKKVQLNASADKIERYDTDNKLTILNGNAVIERDDAILKADKFEMEGSEGNEELEGYNVHIDYKSENAEAFGDNFKSYNKDGYFALWGNSYMIFKNEKTQEKTSKVTGDFMEYYKDADELHVSGNVNIFRTDGIIKGDFARYYRHNNLMVITGNARIEKQDSVLITQSITINTKSNDTRLHGNIRGRGVN